MKKHTTSYFREWKRGHGYSSLKQCLEYEGGSWTRNDEIFRKCVRIIPYNELKLEAQYTAEGQPSFIDELRYKHPQLEEEIQEMKRLNKERREIYKEELARRETKNNGSF